ncbi:reverse transcriptase domain-containing protein [Tanacetum coccineum]
MPNPLLNPQAPQKVDDFDHGTLTILSMGNGCVRTTPRSLRKSEFVIMAVDYFTKWIEAKPLAKMTGKEVKKFVWDNIVCRYGLPKIMVTDDGTNFIHDPFKSWCKKLNITQINTVVAHPQTNGLVERANRSIMEGIKTRLGRERKGWVDEAFIPAEICMPTHRTMLIKEGEGNEEKMRLNLDLLTERKEVAAIREARYKMKMEQYYNKRVCHMSFKIGEYVYRKNEASREENLGNWAQSGKDHTWWWKRIRMAHTSYEQWTTKKCLASGMQST